LGQDARKNMKNRKYLCGFLCTVAALSAALLRAQDRGQARSMVISRGGIVATESPLASQAGVRILERGGNAVDAAITSNAMMGVVEPMMNGIGGDLFVMVYDAKANKLYGLNASGWAPKGLTIEFLQKQGLRDMPQRGINAVTVPGVVDGWQKLADKFGRKKLAEDLSAAIRTAQDGFPVPEWDAAYWAAEVDLLRADEAAAKTYLPQDHAPKVGEIFRNPDLAASLQQIANHGRDAFYKGEIGAKIVEASKRHGGTMTAGLGLRLRQNTARHDRGEEVRLHGSGEIYRRSTKTETAGGYVVVQELGRRTRQTDRPAARELRRQSRGGAAGQRDDLSDCRGSRREYGLAHPEQLRGVWIGNRGTRDRIRPA
jgi:hypothetical protein